MISTSPRLVRVSAARDPDRMINVTPAGPVRPRRPWVLRLWLPVSVLFILLAPFAIAAIPILYLVAPLRRRNWAGAVFTVGATLLALHGTRIDIRAPHTVVSIALF